MASLSAGAIAYASSALTIFVLYPYRDYVKAFDPRHIARVDLREFVLARYRGMMRNPSQPLLLALPPGLLYYGYVVAGGGVAGAVVGGCLLGYVKMFVGTIAYRMRGGGLRYSQRSYSGYKSSWDCVRTSARQFGLPSFFVGGLAAALIAILWHGATLALLQRRHRRADSDGFWTSFASALGIHAFLTFCTAPVRNTFCSALYQRERAGGVRTVSSYAAAEVATFREALGVLRSTLPAEGLRFLMHGVWRTVFKTSIPFAFTYGLFVSLGGSLGASSDRDYRGRYPRGGRHWMRHVH